MFEFISKFFKASETESKDVAKDRLKLVLVHDRNNCSPAFLESIKNDIIEVIKKHMEVDEEELQIEITSSVDDKTGKPALVANIPIKNMTRK